MSYFVGIDLHSDNSYIGVIDKKDSGIFGKKLPNDLGLILKELKPFKKEIEGIVVESTYNWYWLVDGHSSDKYPVRFGAIFFASLSPMGWQMTQFPSRTSSFPLSSLSAL